MTPNVPTDSVNPNIIHPPTGPILSGTADTLDDSEKRNFAMAPSNFLYPRPNEMNSMTSSARSPPTPLELPATLGEILSQANINPVIHPSADLVPDTYLVKLVLYSAPYSTKVLSTNSVMVNRSRNFAVPLSELIRAMEPCQKIRRGLYLLDNDRRFLDGPVMHLRADDVAYACHPRMGTDELEVVVVVWPYSRHQVITVLTLSIIGLLSLLLLW